MKSSIGDKFAQTLTSECIHLLDNAVSFNLLALPGVGVSFFLKHISSVGKFRWIMVNSYEVEWSDENGIYQQLGNKLGISGSADALIIRQKLEALILNNEKIVIVFNRFDRFKKARTKKMYDDLRIWKDVDREKVMYIFATVRPVYETSMRLIEDIYSMFTKRVFLKPFSISDLRCLGNLDHSNQLFEMQSRREAESLSGGHHALWQILLRCQSMRNPLGDPLVEALFENILKAVGPKHRKVLEDWANKGREIDDNYLFEVGLLRRDQEKICGFSPLLEEFLKRHATLNLPEKEKRLLTVLRRHEGRIVSHDEIVDFVWRNESTEVSEWAINALVYRLRHHPYFIVSGSRIVSVKKQGYRLN